MKLQFLNSIPLDVISGGNIYNKAIIEGLMQEHIEIDYHAIPLTKAYDVSIVDSLCMDKINPNNLEQNKPIIALIHQIPNLSSSTLNFYRTYAKFIVTGETTKSNLMRLWQVSEKNIRIIRPGIPDNWSSKTEFRDKLKHIIIVSNFIPNKGFEMLIGILKQLNHLNLKFHVLGNNELDKAYASKIVKAIKKTNGNVEFYFNQSRDEVYNKIIKSDVFLSLSESETFGMSLFEALSLGIPCLAYKAGDFNYFNSFPNYVMLNDYSEDHFAAIIEEWNSNSEIYKSYCNTSPQIKRNWKHVIEEFSTELKNWTLAC